MAITKTTTYLGNVERIESSNSNTITWRRTVAGAVYITETDKSYQPQGSVDKSYIYKDHLGSTDVITGKAGTIKQSMSFDAWGQRRDSNSWDPISDAAKRAFNTELTNDGFTGHEQLDEVGLIHMNGRVYDPKLARFLQADPFIQAPNNTQSYNRYSYVLNNPLNATNPSGYFFDKVGDFFKQIPGAVVAVAMTAWCGPACGAGVWKAITIGGVSGAVGAAANGGNVLRGALTGALGGAMFYGVGQAFSGTDGLFAEGGFGHISAHGLTGGVMSEIQGGQFKHGFISAGFTKAMNINGMVEGDSASAVAARVTTAALVGGTASEISGGKFANGAVTAALAQAVNGESANKRRAGATALQATKDFERTLLAGRKGVVTFEDVTNSATLKYNKRPPHTVRPKGRTLEALQCTADCTGLEEVLVTGGSETAGHSPNSLHYQNRAVDIAGPEFNDVQPDTILQCAIGCGFTHGHFEDFPGDSRDHTHLQIGPENYRDPNEYKLTD